MAGYDYQTERVELFKESEQTMFLAIRDHVKYLLKTAGAFTMEKATSAARSGSSWTMMACVDRLVELGEIVEVPTKQWAQYRIFTEKHDDR